MGFRNGHKGEMILIGTSVSIILAMVYGALNAFILKDLSGLLSQMILEIVLGFGFFAAVIFLLRKMAFYGFVFFIFFAMIGMSVFNSFNLFSVIGVFVGSVVALFAVLPICWGRNGPYR